MSIKSIHDSFKRGSEIDVDFLFYLYCRWLDEGEYEDVNEYLGQVKKIIPEADSIDEDDFTIHCIGRDGRLDISFIEGKDNSIKVNFNFVYHVDKEE